METAQKLLQDMDQYLPERPKHRETRSHCPRKAKSLSDKLKSLASAEKRKNFVTRLDALNIDLQRFRTECPALYDSLLRSRFPIRGFADLMNSRPRLVPQNDAVGGSGLLEISVFTREAISGHGDDFEDSELYSLVQRGPAKGGRVLVRTDEEQDHNIIPEHPATWTWIDERLVRPC